MVRVSFSYFIEGLFLDAISISIVGHVCHSQSHFFLKFIDDSILEDLERPRITLEDFLASWTVSFDISNI